MWQTEVFLICLIKWSDFAWALWVGRDWGTEKCVPISRFLLQQLAGKALGYVANTTGPGPAETGDPLLHILRVTSSAHLTLICSIT